MYLLKGIVMAFSIYSKIPVPQLSWDGDDMKYMLCFFPWVGAVIGAGVYLWNVVCGRIFAGDLCRSLGVAVIPLVITGGFHVDGFMDTMDALHSYGSREKKLEILKDPHIGAFAVIMIGLYGLVYLGAVSEIRSDSCLRVLCGGFFLARCLSGIGVVCFPAAKTEGMVYTFADRAHRQKVKWCLAVQGAVCVLGMVMVGDAMAAIGGTVAALGWFWRYYRKCRKELGGITGDTAGWFVVECEVGMAVVVAIVDVLVQ